MAVIEQSNVMPGSFGHYRTGGAPVNGTSGTFAGVAPIGAKLVRTDTGVDHVNTGTQASPTWTVVGTQV